MARFGEFRYLKDGVLYGERSKLALSAEPLVATALRYNKVSVSFATPTGDYIAFRIVRNQDSYPETEQDGAVLFESITGSAGITNTVVIDSDAVSGAPLIEGRFAYYKAWILAADDEYWSPAGQTYVLVPSKHNLKLGNEVSTSGEAVVVNGVTTIQTNDVTISTNTDLSTTHQRFMDIIPRVLTSATNGSVDELTNPDVDSNGENTTISKFLSGFSFTLDEFLTFSKLVLPDISGKFTAPEIMRLQAHQFGITNDNELLTRAQKRLIREAIYIYSRKGTDKGLDTFTECVTGFNNTRTYSKNLLLSYEDSTFRLPNWETGNVVGNWTVDSSDSVSVEASVTPQTGITKSLDDSYVAKITTAASSKPIYLGILNPIVTAIPVTGGEKYSLSYYVKKVSTTAGVTPTIFWYDSNGKWISNSAGTSGNATSTEWNRRSLANISAPVTAKYAVIQLVFATAGTYYLDMVQFEQSETVTSYEEPGGVTIFLNPEKTNYIKNPSFEDDTTGWATTGTGVSLTRQDTTLVLAPALSYMAELTCSSSTATTLKVSTDKELTPGKLYTFSFYARAAIATQITVTATPKDVSTLVGDAIVKQATITSSWTRISVPVFIVPHTGLVSVDLQLGFASGSPVIEIDAVQFERGVLSDYFDGTRYDSGAAWTGAINNSTSVIYPGIKNKVARYSNDISEVLPANTPYYIDFYGISNIENVVFFGIS
jgi:hypothetical protein